MIDRPLRPLFPEGYNRETQVIGLLLSADLENDSDTLAIIGASTALYLSDIPFDDPVGAVRVGYWDGQVVVNPSSTDLRTKSQLNLLVAGTEDAIVMVESGAHEITEEVMVQALDEGHEAIKQIVALQKDLRARAGKQKRSFAKKEIDPASWPGSRRRSASPLLAAMRTPGKLESYARMKKVQGRVRGPHPGARSRREARRRPRRSTRRCARRSCAARSSRTAAASTAARFDEIRPITCEVGVLPRTHGSALFTRGETQALVTVTLGTSEDMQIIDTVQEPEHKKRFMLHYNFPPFSVGEVKFLRGPGRREIGHGALAERALREMLPDEEAFPYTVRIVSDILESNGSSSMASICGGTLALMDAGRAHEAAGGRRGHGPGEGGRQVRRPLRHRRRGGPLRRHGLQGRGHARRHHRPADGHQDRRHHRRDHGQGARAGARGPAAHPRQDGRGARRSRAPSISTYAPRILTIKVPVDKIRDIIGPGGKMIRSIVERTGCKIDVEDDGRVSIASVDEARRAQGDRDHRGAHRHRRAQQDLPGQGRARGRLRRLRRDPARHRRAAPRLRDGRTTACRTCAAR